ncbi:type VI secretion system tip protein TssI/VgrG [Flexibacterium corallicola]|uniref:type VI secretion system tip protein TssI/VgrG n=1 Tax=Flexibacterium corallicola TaxID=3037259 RepID=UPI00286F12DA|nr:type VI secretion system tip protein TssI/VgrG [Pseudovibrio sp. M1P-2-3]
MNVINPLPTLLQKDDLAFTFYSPHVEENDLLVEDFSVTEQVFELTRIEVSLVSKRPDIDLQALIDTPASISVLHKYAGIRHFSGVVHRARRRNQGHHRTSYEVTLLPSLHRLDYGSDCRIFQLKSVPEIIKETLKRYGIENIKWHLTGEHVAREYCVQYRETHYEFIRRLCAEEGIWFYFTHSKNGSHILHFIDNYRIISTQEGQPQLEYNATSGGVTKGVFCQNLSVMEEVRSSKWTMRDYTFKNPPYNQEHTAIRQEDNGLARDYAMYDYPGRYKKDAAGKPFTRSLMEATRVGATLAEGQTNAVHMLVGHKFELTDHPDSSTNIKYHLLSAVHTGSQPGALEEEAVLGGSTFFITHFEAIPDRLAYAPPQRTRPKVDGSQIATVVGPAGEEIYTDEHGRVKVQFPWDRYGESNDRSSCWIRVASNWAGGAWGHIAIPRIGHEVIVDFLEGDPDQPIVTGRTYHANNKPPYKLPDHKTKMVIRSDSHKGNGYNEISFEDQAGEENIFTHAQKDQTLKILNNRAKRVENNQIESVGSNKNIEVGANHQEKIGGSMNLTVGGGTGGALLGALGAVVAAGGADAKAGSARTGNGEVGAFAGAVAAVGAAAETTALGANASFNSAGGHFSEGGKKQQGTAGFLGGLLSSLMPMSGIVNTVIEKFRSETIGLAETKQIGAYKNTSVGHTYTINVAEEFVVTVGKSRFIMKKDGSVRILGDNLNITMSGPVQINGKTIDLN